MQKPNRRLHQRRDHQQERFRRVAELYTTTYLDLRNSLVRDLLTSTVMNNKNIIINNLIEKIYRTA